MFDAHKKINGWRVCGPCFCFTPSAVFDLYNDFLAWTDLSLATNCRGPHKISFFIAKHNAFPDAQVKPTRIGVCACTCVCVRPVDVRIHQPIESQHPTALGVTAPAQLPSAMLHFRHSLCTSSPPSSTNSAVTNSCSLQPLSPPTFPSPTWPSSPLIL